MGSITEQAHCPTGKEDIVTNPKESTANQDSGDPKNLGGNPPDLEGVNHDTVPFSSGNDGFTFADTSGEIL